MADDPTLVSVQDAARQLGLTERQVRYLTEKGALEAVRVCLTGRRQPLVGIPQAALGVSTSSRPPDGS